MRVLAYLFHQPDVKHHEVYLPKKEKPHVFLDQALHQGTVLVMLFFVFYQRTSLVFLDLFGQLLYCFERHFYRIKQW